MADQSTQTALQPKDSIIFHVEGLALGEKKSAQFLANTDVAILGVHFLTQGEKTESTGHEHMDGFWFVKSGRVRLTPGDGSGTRELGEGEGALIPMGCAYTFEALASDGDKPAQLIQFEVSGVTLPARLGDVKRELGLL